VTATSNEHRFAPIVAHRLRWPSLVLGGALCVLALGCAADEKGPQGPGGLMAERRADGTIIDDRALCEFQGVEGLEVGETAGPGAIQPNVRRVWKVFGVGSDRRKILVCREVDTNLDGLKDVVRTYNDEGQSKEERADTNYDGKLDTWNYFAKGRLSEVRLDNNHDGEPDEWKIYIGGDLSRVKRDTNFDTKPDVWEMYRKGRLERMGVDVDGDERVDRWDHDTDWRRETEQAAKKKRELEEEKKKKEMDRRRREAEEEAEG
jgi:hypothetical protein